MVAMEIDVPGVSAATYTQDIQLASHCSVTYMHANSLTACMRTASLHTCIIEQ